MNGEDSTPPDPISWKRTLAAGALLGIAGVVLFGVIHAWTIEPIWTRLFAGLLFAIPAGIATAWSFQELARARGSRAGWTFGLLFGVIIWLTLLPMTAFAVWLRLSGLRSRLGGMEGAVELAIAALTAFAVAYALGKSRRAAVAFAVSLVGLVLAMAGPVAVTMGPGARALFAAFLPLYAITGLLLTAAFRGRLRDASGS